jgi:hypothetical protein
VPRPHCFVTSVRNWITVPETRTAIGDTVRLAKTVDPERFGKEPTDSLRQCNLHGNARLSVVTSFREAVTFSDGVLSLGADASPDVKCLTPLNQRERPTVGINSVDVAQ